MKPRVPNRYSKPTPTRKHAKAKDRDTFWRHEACPCWIESLTAIS
jgi:hypothetical protein